MISCTAIWKETSIWTLIVTILLFSKLFNEIK
jgi:hypothetical protein